MFEPNEKLKEIRELIAHLRSCKEVNQDFEDTADDLADAVDEMDIHLTHMDGALPDDWGI